MDDALLSLTKTLTTAGYTLVGPRKVGEDTLYAVLDRPEDLLVDPIIPANTLKEFLFPKTEVLLRYAPVKNDVQLEDVPREFPKTAFVAVRPCDAAGLAAMDKLFAWDYLDPFYLDRRKNSLVIALACDAPPAECFCTQTGRHPAASEGSDLLLINNGGKWRMLGVTEAGKAVAGQVSGMTAIKAEEAEEYGRARATRKGETYDLPAIRAVVDQDFDNATWRTESFACLSCGTCTFRCPTCHCFDIQDEARMGKGVRVKNWDGCQFPLFTLHASTHNPREHNWQRYRQRWSHKFKIFPERFGVNLCVGCGRCVRDCPVGMDIYEIGKAVGAGAGSTNP